MAVLDLWLRQPQQSVPQLVMPMSLDQPDNAARIKKLGVGDSILPRNFKPRLVAEKLKGLLSNPKVKENCQKYAQRVDFEQAILDTCNLLEKFSWNKIRGSVCHQSPISLFPCQGYPLTI